MIDGVTIGLLGLSAAFVSRAFLWHRQEQSLWGLSGLASLLLFASAPRPFAEVLPWAAAGAMIWVPGDAQRKHELFHATAAGYLLGAGVAHPAFVLGDMVPWSAEAASLLVIGLACAAGAVLAGVAGAAMAGLAGCLAIGAFSSAAVTLGAVLAAALAVAPGRHARGLAAAAFPFLPALALLEGAP